MPKLQKPRGGTADIESNAVNPNTATQTKNPKGDEKKDHQTTSVRNGILGVHKFCATNSKAKGRIKKKQGKKAVWRKEKSATQLSEPSMLRRTANKGCHKASGVVGVSWADLQLCAAKGKPQKGLRPEKQKGTKSCSKPGAQ